MLLIIEVPTEFILLFVLGLELVRPQPTTKWLSQVNSRVTQIVGHHPLISAFSLAFAGAFFAFVLGQFYWNYLDSPILEVEFQKESERGQIKGEEYQGHKIKVRNAGTAVAKNCTVVLRFIEDDTSSDFTVKWDSVPDPEIDLKYIYNSLQKLDIPPSMYHEETATIIAWAPDSLIKSDPKEWKKDTPYVFTLDAFFGRDGKPNKEVKESQKWEIHVMADNYYGVCNMTILNTKKPGELNAKLSLNKHCTKFRELRIIEDK